MRLIKNYSIFNESLEEELCRPINDEEYKYWRSKKYEKLSDESLTIIKEQICEFLHDYGYKFEEDKCKISDYRFTYNGNPIYGPSDPSLRIAVSSVYDDWYLVEIYFNWYFYTFLCDDTVGLKQLYNCMIEEIKK